MLNQLLLGCTLELEPSNLQREVLRGQLLPTNLRHLAVFSGEVRSIDRLAVHQRRVTADGPLSTVIQARCVSLTPTLACTATQDNGILTGTLWRPRGWSFPCRSTVRPQVFDAIT
nr:hypothetical protein CFP56_65851 [Quercus suber]